MGANEGIRFNGNGASYTSGVNGISHTDEIETPHMNGTNGVDNTPQMNGANKTSESNGVHETADDVEPHIPIAICGMSLRLPGGLSSAEEFWEFLLNKGDARTRVPQSRYNIDAYYTGSKQAGAIASEYGYFLGENVNLGALDTSRFSLSRAELEFADPQQRRLLEVVREAFDDAGDVSFRVSLIY